jgi:preprotein translocase subunit YajC
MLHTLLLLAEGDQPSGSPFWFNLLPFLVLAMLVYFILMRPMRRQEAERQSLLTGTKKNDKVLTTAGIYGTVVSVAEKEDEVVLKIDDNCRIKVVKAAIMRNLTNEEALKAAQAKGKEAAPAQPAAGSNAVTTGQKS